MCCCTFSAVSRRSGWGAWCRERYKAGGESGAGDWGLGEGDKPRSDNPMDEGVTDGG